MDRMAQKMPAFMKFLSLAGLVLLLAACTGPSVIPGTGGTPSMEPTMPVITVLPATSEPLVTNTPVPQPGSEPTTTAVVETAPASGQELSVTLADESKTIKLKVGQRFLLNLGSDYDWTPTVADQSIVSRVLGITVIRGAQGVYEAHAPGATMLTASGDPTCRQSKPACSLPSRSFEVTIVVEK
jgi:hypothetical protein